MNYVSQCQKVSTGIQNKLTSRGPLSWRVFRLTWILRPIIFLLLISHRWRTVTAKQFQRCEFVQVLIQHGIPQESLGNWTCLATWTSNLTSTNVYRATSDSIAANYGIFKIDNKYWCADERGGNNTCNVHCNDLSNTNLTDDIQCVEKILSGNELRFEIWEDWNLHCKNQDLDSYTDGCTAGKEELPDPEIQPPPGVTTIKNGEGGRINCNVMGSGELTVEWESFHGIEDLRPHFDPYAPAGTVVLYLDFPKNVTTNGIFDFKCLASNSVGNDSEIFKVEIKKPADSGSDDRPVFDLETAVPIAIVGIAVILSMSLIIYQKFLFKVYGLTDEEIQQFEYGVPSKLNKIFQCRDKAPQVAKEIFHYLPYDKRFEIKEEELRIKKHEILGSGHFGIVYKGIYKGKEVAVKSPKGPHDTTAHIKALLTELKIMIHIGEHVNIVNLVGAQTGGLKKAQLHIAVEYCELGDLEQYLRARQEYFVDPTLPVCYISGGELRCEAQAKDPITFLDLLTWSSQIAAGMAHLESKKVIHGDLACRNVLLYKKDVAKISDFGLSRQLYAQLDYVKSEESPLPWRWMAFESLTSFSFCSKSDSWSFGVTLWEIFSLGEVPYPGLSWSQEFPALLKRGMRLLRPEHASPKIYDVMLSCWELNRHSRPNFNSLAATLTQIKNDFQCPSWTINLIDEEQEEEYANDSSSSSNS